MGIGAIPLACITSSSHLVKVFGDSSLSLRRFSPFDDCIHILCVRVVEILLHLSDFWLRI